MEEVVLRGIPKPLYERLKLRAIQNHRSLDSEVIASLEVIFNKEQIDVTALLQRARVLRSKISGQLVDEELFALKNQGRP